MMENWRKERTTYSKEVKYISVNLDLFDEGASQTEDFLIFKSGTNFRVYDRVCDHNNGRLSVQDGVGRCPLHGWSIDLSTGEYENVKCTKQPLLIVDEHELDTPLIEVPLYTERFDLKGYKSRYVTRVEFINHACLYFEVDDGLSFATDPWVVGPAFNNGWWLAKSSPDDVFERLNRCDFLYISHNHPDHLHPLSLEHVRKDMPILTAAFESRSTYRYLKQLGFGNITALDFATRLVAPDREICMTVLKSGDFRDDSGLLVEIGDFSCLLTVDSNFLDFGRFPENVDLMCSSFASGSSGFPLCFENYSEQEKNHIIVRNRGARRAINKGYIESCNPTFFMPYAGFFSEKAARDIYIKSLNIKNNIRDYSPICEKTCSTLLDCDEHQIFEFSEKGKVLRSKRTQADYRDLEIGEYIEISKNSANRLSDAEIDSYFINSGFHDDLILKIELTSDDFSSTFRSWVVDFDKDDDPKITRDVSDNDVYTKSATKRFLRIKVREYEFYDVISNGKPWENLSIGFQMRIFRHPNIYNSRFWFHFTNLYISDSVPALKTVGEPAHF